MNIIEVLEQEQLRSDIPEFRAGDTVNAYSESPAMLMEDYGLYLAGKKPRFFVNPEVGMGR